MSPRTSTLLALIGVLLAGIPLPALTSARQESAGAEAALCPTPPRERHRTCITLRYSGQPTELHLLHEGRQLAQLTADECPDGLWEAELPLPAHEHLALEIEARWPEDAQPQAVTLILEPEGLPQQQHTEWTEAGSRTLHSLFTFSW